MIFNWYANDIEWYGIEIYIQMHINDIEVIFKWYSIVMKII